MQINWYGEGCFKIQTKPQRGGNSVIITTDLFDKKVGLRPPQGQMDILTLSNSEYLTGKISEMSSKTFIVDSAGEYSLKGINIEGVESFQDKNGENGVGRNNIFIIESEDIRICHLGKLGHPLTEDQMETIGEVDILLMPVGNPEILSIKNIKSIIGQLEPGIIIPMYYKIKGLKRKAEDCTSFCKEFGGNANKKEQKLTIKSKDVKDMENNIIVLKAN